MPNESLSSTRFLLNTKLSTIKQYCFFSLFFFCLLLAGMPSSKANLNSKLADGTPLNLVGIGIYKELRNDIYIGALFASYPGAKADELLGEEVGKRMSIRFVGDYTNRKIARHWKERLAMNNARDEWQPLTREIKNFANIFKRNLKPGDEINIDYLPGTGTQVYLNGTLFTLIDKPKFIDLLLNVWLGANPPTKAFKENIRGVFSASDKDDFIASYSGAEPVKGRFDADLDNPPVQIAAKDKKPKPAANNNQDQRVAQNENPPAAVKPVVPKPAPPKPAVPEPTTPKIAENTAPAKNKPEPVAIAKTEDKKPPVTVAEEPAAPKPIDKPAAPKPEPTVTPESSAKDTNEKIASLPRTLPEAEAEEDLFDADLLSGAYIRELLQAIRKNQSYPEKALERSEQGLVVAKVIIDKNGKPKHISVVERARSVHLNRATIKMIRKTELPPIPKELKLEEFEFEVPISYNLE